MGAAHDRVTVDDEGGLARIESETANLENGLWQTVIRAANANPTPPMALAVSGMNDVFNARGYTQASWWNRIPLAAWGMMGLIAIAVRAELVDLSLVGTRIDLGEEVADVHGLPFGEIDADDLSLDLAAHDVGVIRDYRADAGKVDGHVVLLDRSGDDRHRRRRTGLWRK